MQTPDVLVDRARRLFQFLARAQQLRTSAIPTTDRYERDGSVHWIAKLPDHPAVRLGSPLGQASDGDGPILSIARLPKMDPPPLPDNLRGWVDIEPHSLLEPKLRRERREVEATAQAPSDIADYPEIALAFDWWMTEWKAWATEETSAQPVRDLYETLFRTHMSSVQRGEELELVLGAGLLTWHAEAHQPVSRHVFTAPLGSTIDDQTGTLTFSVDTSAIGTKVELDMLDPALVPESAVVTTLNQAGTEFTGSLLHEPDVATLAKALVNKLAASGRYNPSAERPAPTADPVITWAPALILRARPNTGLVAAFDMIADEIAESGVVPEGLLPLLDPDRTPTAQPDPSPGALLAVDGEIFSPLPLNQEQRTIIERVDRNAQTIVQGPPGTGKTHTAAALLSHLLAQGKRVLVTAHTDRALGEVRSKLPAQVRPLAVSVIGSSRSDMADLKVAVETIGRRSVDHDHATAEREIQRSLEEVEKLRLRRIELAQQLIAVRERETTTVSHAGYTGTLAQIAQRCHAEQSDFAWLPALADLTPGTPSPFTNAEVTRYRDLLVDPVLATDAEEARRRHVNREELLSPEQFAQVITRLTTARVTAAGHEAALAHPAREALLQLGPAQRKDVVVALDGILTRIRGVERFPATWAPAAVADVRAGFATSWFDRADTIGKIVEQVGPGVEELGVGTTIRADGDPGQLKALAVALREHLASGNTVKTAPDGTPKIGMFTNATVKASRPLLENVRVDGLPPTTVQRLDLLLRWFENDRLLDDLDRSWPDGTQIPSEDTQRERLSWHRGQLHQLREVVDVAASIGSAARLLHAAGVAQPDWRDDDEIQALVAVSHGVETVSAVQEAQAPIEAMLERLRQDLALGDTAQADGELLVSAEAEDGAAYAAAWRRLDDLASTSARLTERSELGSRLWATCPRLAAAITDAPEADEWHGRLARFEEAWAWGTTEAWILSRESIDPNQIQNEITDIEQRIREHAESIAALRAWNHAVGRDRLTPGSRADLTQYAQLVRRLGKGTGKYAAQQRAEIKQAMDRCRPAVPVWILPIYRIADQLRIEQNMFDVVLIDEASQAGLEATFLQYLAPKIVVIGDDKQVSPSAVGVDQEPLRKLADQYLYDDRFKASWQDPKRSLFDDALMRFGGQITLMEHRRCVPEIIGFSNRIAYEPDNIRLRPVRQFGADRLTPIKTVHVEDGLMEGASGNRVNRAEARALVDRLKRCLNDPRYDGKTFGVISLTGRRQAQLIESMLLSEVSPDDWTARDLRVGDAPDFQGSERHVVFLSMVASWEPGVRTAPLTQEMYVQRYNVAVSRAQDQLWLFHSLTVDQLPREDDMRHQLLAYCDEIVRRGPDVPGETSPPVPEDTRVDPFDSLFEQRVYNRIVERGFVVVPQLHEQGYRIDLVVVGGSTRLAVECDGDAWHGPDAYQRDLARQRELERCGWTFCRIRESEFYVDTHRAMKDVWRALEELDIRPFAPAPSEGDDIPPLNADDESPAGRAALAEQLRRENDSVITAATNDTPAPWTSSVDTNAEPTSMAGPSAAVDPNPTEPRSHSSADADGGAEPALAPDLERYADFSGSVPSVVQATQNEIIDGLLSIVAVEGPVQGNRLRTTYVTHSGGLRVGRFTADVLDRALTEAVRRGVLVGDNPFRQPGFAETSFRLPHQPSARPRTLGRRTLDEVPGYELAEMIRRAASAHPGLSMPELYRVVLGDLGRRSLTKPARERFDRVVTAVLGDDADMLDASRSLQRSSPGPDVTPPAGSTPAPDDAEATILAVVQEQGRIARAGVVAVTGLEPAKATALLADMTAKGLLERRGERRGAHYVLPSTPPDAVYTEASPPTAGPAENAPIPFDDGEG